MNIYVGNLPWSTTDQQLKDLFAGYGEVVSVKLIADRETKRPKGFGFVEMADESSGEAAISGLDGKDFNGRPLKVNKSKPQERPAWKERESY